MTSYTNGGVSAKAPTLKFIIGNGVEIKRTDEPEKLPRYASNLYQTIEK